MCFLYLAGSPKDKLQLWLRLLLGPWPDSSMHLAVDVFFLISSQRRSLRLGGVVLIISSTTSGVGGHLHNWLALAVAIVYTHAYIQQACLCQTIGSSSWARCSHLSTLCAWNWGHQLQFMAMPQWRLRWESWHSDGRDKRPLCAAGR
jgi:hypothetical protein